LQLNEYEIGVDILMKNQKMIRIAVIIVFIIAVIFLLMLLLIRPDEVQGAAPTAPYTRSYYEADEYSTNQQAEQEEERAVLTGANTTSDINLMEIEHLGEVHLELTDRFTVVRTFRLHSDEPGFIPRNSFEFNNKLFEFYSMERLDTDRTRSVEHSEQISIETRTSDIIEIMNSLYAVLLYDDGYFKGELHLQHDSIRTTAMPYVIQWRTTRDVRVYNNIPFGDISGFARTINRSGVNLNLVDVEWLPNTQGMNNNLISISYNARVHYEGSYPVSVVPGFITTATYSGVITYFDLNPEIIYEVSFVSMTYLYEYDEYYGYDQNDEYINDYSYENNDIYYVFEADRRIAGGLLGIILLVVVVIAGFLFNGVKLGFFNLKTLISRFSKSSNVDSISTDDSQDRWEDFDTVEIPDDR